MKQESGDNSTNIQAGGNVVIGITYTEAKDIALDIFKANFYELSQSAAQTAYQRAEEMSEEILNKIYEKIPEHIEKLKEPSVQSSLYNVQKEYAKTGDKELEAQLINLLLERISSEERSLKQIVLDEAITVLPKLTEDHVNLLSFILCASQINYSDINNIQNLEHFINNFIVKFFPKNMSNYSFFTHLLYCGCYMLPTGTRAYMSLEEYYKQRFKGLFINGFTEHEFKEFVGLEMSTFDNFIIPNLRNPQKFQFNAIHDNDFNSKIAEFDLGNRAKLLTTLWNQTAMSNEQVKETIIKINPEMVYICKAWQETIIREMFLTSVGFAIGIANYNRVSKTSFKFETFI